jgi:membrane protease YdiL (CAAX protease family)
MQRTDSVRQAGEIRQHSIALSILLHLVPGLVSLGALFALSQPVFFRSLGMAPELGPLFGYTGANLLVLVPILLGWLVIEGWQYLALVPLFIAFNFAMFMVVAPLIQPTIVDAFFAWWPEQYNFQNAMQDLDRFSRYSGVQALAIAYALTLGILTPLVEELYFRGYLLPRMEGYAKKWAPLLNVALFSIYHFFSPWENPVRIVALLPQFYVVWRKRDIRFGIWTHVLINMIGGVMILVAVFAP